MSEKDLLMLGSVPLETPEEVFQICGRTIGEYLPWMPDGETDERIWWVNMLAYRVYHGHPDIETMKRPPPESGGNMTNENAQITIAFQSRTQSSLLLFESLDARDQRAGRLQHLISSASRESEHTLDSNRRISFGEA
jgi:hypothetical protein